MTCKDCVKYNECEKYSKSSPYRAHMMWMFDFWENAECRCVEFKKQDLAMATTGESKNN